MSETRNCPIHHEDGALSIVLTDEEGNELDTYTIDLTTGIGTDTEGEEVNLPQNGSHSLTELLMAVTAFMMTAPGGYAVCASGILRRKLDQKD